VYQALGKIFISLYPHNSSKYTKSESKMSWALVAHTCISSYSGGRDQEDCSSKPAQASSSRNPISEKTQHKKHLAEWLKW
jgi:hypothetical protein